MTPNQLPNAPLLPAWVRTSVAKAVTLALRSQAAAAQLNALLGAAVQSLVATVADVVAPTVSTRTQAFTEKVIVLTYNGALHPSFVPPVGAFAITSPTRTVTAVDVVGSTVRITYSGTLLVTADSPDIAYTQDVASGHRDLAGNLAATFAAAAVTVAGS